MAAWVKVGARVVVHRQDTRRPYAARGVVTRVTPRMFQVELLSDTDRYGYFAVTSTSFFLETLATSPNPSSNGWATATHVIPATDPATRELLAASILSDSQDVARAAVTRLARVHVASWRADQVDAAITALLALHAAIADADAASDH